MIKLNNKNITYVALADSNNSLKAPKEIWYADSNNSVKLVYRRKDALIEGEDYEKYHWLVSNSEDSQTPYIDTLIPPDLNQNIIFSFKVIDSNTNGGEPGVWGAISTSWNRCIIRCYKNTSYDYIILEYNNNTTDFPQKENMIIKTEFSEGNEYDCSLSINSSTTALGVINNESKELVANSNVSFVLNPQPTHKLFVQQTNVKWSFNSVGFKKFNITNLISLVPCKLLKPVPKWLDANGIRRQVGECGMIDLVSGKFYGNVNSVGTFTVENYYERKKWLQGRNGAYIDTNYYPIVGTDVFSVHFHYDGTIKNPDGGEQDVFGVNYVTESSNNFIRTFISRTNCLSCSYYKYTNSYPTTFQNSLEWDIVDLMIDGSDFKYNANGVNYSFANNDIRQQTCPSPLFVFKNNDNVFNQNCYLHGDISSFKITDTSSNTKMNLIPCTLTMDLPASMDANNIARTKGTSGMWDLVSDKFYGNVANSGTFKAVNLAEGVDYEVHQWLVANIPIGVTMMRLFINQSSSVNYTMNITTTSNSIPLFRTAINGNKEYYVYYNNNSKLCVWNYMNQTSESVNAIYSNNGLYNIELSPSEFIINSVSATKYGDAYTIVWHDNPNDSTAGVTSTSSITVDGIERYIPVKLLKSIPSKYDANGIARQAGECGMYDTVNDVFYGNVASSGSFTVSDDN